ncbi:MAG: hypothetical protein RLZZ04_1898 [Cyanobacteriota bacterium]|jgi:acyl-CoA thioesterase FadM
MAIAETKNIETTIVKQYPRFEGANILDGIGFKHIMYLAEEAVLQHFREKELSASKLYWDYGLCFEVVKSRVNIRRALRVDELISIEVKPKIDSEEKEQTFSIQMFVGEGNKRFKSVIGELKVLFREDRKENVKAEPPSEIKPYIVSEISRLTQQIDTKNKLTQELDTPVNLGRGVSNPDDELIDKVVPKEANAFVWKWHIPYFYCHFTNWMQHSGYIRLVEEVVDLFLADRGISIRTMLDTRQWIPIVSDAEIEILQEAMMEEIIYVVYTVEKIFKDLTYTSKVDFYVVRDGRLIQTARGRITHGYIKLFYGTSSVGLARFDEKTLNALQGTGGIE